MKAQIIKSPTDGKPPQVRLITENDNEQAELALLVSVAMRGGMTMLGKSGTDTHVKSASFGFHSISKAV